MAEILFWTESGIPRNLDFSLQIECNLRKLPKPTLKLTLSNLRWLLIHHNWTNDSGVMVPESWECCWHSFLDRTRYLDTFGIWAYLEWKTGRTLNTGIIEHFINFLTRGRTQNFDSERRSYVQLKLIEFRRFDFQFKSISSFFQL
jgi:hypothetical protein